MCCPELRKSRVGEGLRNVEEVWSSRFVEFVEEPAAIHDWLLHCRTFNRVHSTQVLCIPDSVDQSKGLSEESKQLGVTWAGKWHGGPKK